MGAPTCLSAPPRLPGYVDVGLIPAGARDIRIQELAEASNFLALRSQDPGKYFLNGDWIIQWHGDYEVAGTTFTYARRGNWENLTSPGPTEEPIWIQVLPPTAAQGKGQETEPEGPRPHGRRRPGAVSEPGSGLVVLLGPLPQSTHLDSGPRSQGWLCELLPLRVVTLGGRRGCTLLTGPTPPAAVPGEQPRGAL